jgi:hypothetical protein
MSVQSDQKAAFVSTVRQLSNELLAVLDRIHAVMGPYNNRDYFNGLSDADVTAAAEGLTKAQVIAAVGSLNTVATYVSTNNHDDALHVVSS